MRQAEALALPAVRFRHKGNDALGDWIPGRCAAPEKGEETAALNAYDLSEVSLSQVNAFGTARAHRNGVIAVPRVPRWRPSTWPPV